VADSRVVAEIVSDFFLNTCRLRRPFNLDTIAALSNSSRAAVMTKKFDIIPLSTGSVAEFYIEPMLSCIGDVDIMFHYSYELAIPQGHPPPTQLPDEFHGRDVEVYEIMDSEFPGYVYLVLSYLLTEIADDGKYNAVQCPPQHMEHFTSEEDDRIHGPAFVTKYSHPNLTSVIESYVVF